MEIKPIDSITKPEWEAYRIVQNMGEFNMFSPDAVSMSGLDKATYFTIIKFYKEQLRKFDKLGIGKETEHGTVVTERLIENTKTRLHELQFKNIKKAVDKQVFRAKKKNADVESLKQQIYVLEYNLMRLKEDVGLV